ncbi:integrin beta-5-like isoform X2 [Convolutriloba macropyga]|uniref:integrin beta-5-like isoform X2 n=1 Tax=Convolutriloba macropyga TaxID=536237 RepID=UPI003F5259B6
MNVLLQCTCVLGVVMLVMNTTAAFGQECNLAQFHLDNGCPSEYINDPKNVIQMPGNIAVGPKSEDVASAVNMQPQLVNLKMRPGSTERFNVTIYVSKNYPVDLYYLVDNTVSMMDDFKNLAVLSDQLIAEMNSLTQNFHLGLGTFSDKPMRPWIFTDFYTQKPVALCDDCAIPDVFRHQHKLTNISGEEFAIKLKDVKFAATIDDTEATLEAMMQVVVCPKIIGWRQNSKRILLVSTESIAHFSGDGAFSGLLTKHDGECHLTEEGIYTAGDKFDFPTLETLFYKLKDSRIQTVFAIPEHRKKYYEEIVRVLPMSIVAVMAEDSKDLVEVVVESFTKIAKLVQLSFVQPPQDDVIVNITAFCPSGEIIPDTTNCEDVGFDSTVTFEVSVTAPLNDYFYSSFSLAQESLEHWTQLTVNVESLTGSGAGACDCTDPRLYPQLPQTDASGNSVCSGNGYVECGGCVCNSGFTGDDCQCSESVPLNMSLCQSPSIGVSLPCSDRGTCGCDGCKCLIPPLGDDIVASLRGFNPRVFGEFCQCDNWSCRKASDNGLVCGGPERGRCTGCDDNGASCECEPEYTGKACDCPVSTATCVSEVSGLICNGQGECVCGECRCFPNSTYRGEKCEQCFNCPDIHCEPNKECVICAYEHRDEIVDDEERGSNTNNTSGYPQEGETEEKEGRKRVNLTDIVDRYCHLECRNVLVYMVEEESEGEGREQCIVEDENEDCSYLFYYFPRSPDYEDSVVNGSMSTTPTTTTTSSAEQDLNATDIGYPVRVAVIEIRKKYCEDALLLILIILAIIIGILLIGMSVLIVWKIVVTIQDRREFAEFQSALKQADVKRNENPMFIKPTQTVSNPAHEQDSSSRRSLRIR